MDKLLYKCNICTFEYKTKNGLQKHIRTKHTRCVSVVLVNNKNNEIYMCKYCNNKFKYRQSKWTHERKCIIDNKISLKNQVEQLSNEIKELKSNKNQVINNNYTNTTTNILNNNKVQYIIKETGFEGINHLSIDKQREIMQKGLNSLTYLIQITNFNKELPENHSYCVTALNDRHASIIDVETNCVVKTDKNSLFDKILVNNLKNLESMCDNPKFKSKERIEYKDKISALKDLLFINRNGLKIYYANINLISYNNKDIILDTWASLKTLDKIIELEDNKPQILAFDRGSDNYNINEINKLRT